jgi:hypothetical protein
MTNTSSRDSINELIEFALDRLPDTEARSRRRVVRLDASTDPSAFSKRAHDALTAHGLRGRQGKAGVVVVDHAEAVGEHPVLWRPFQDLSESFPPSLPRSVVLFVFHTKRGAGEEVGVKEDLEIALERSGMERASIQALTTNRLFADGEGVLNIPAEIRRGVRDSDQWTLPGLVARLANVGSWMWGTSATASTTSATPTPSTTSSNSRTSR